MDKAEHLRKFLSEKASDLLKQKPPLYDACELGDPQSGCAAG